MVVGRGPARRYARIGRSLKVVTRNTTRSGRMRSAARSQTRPRWGRGHLHRGPVVAALLKPRVGVGVESRRHRELPGDAARARDGDHRR
jgi:hypothetical protein